MAEEVIDLTLSDDDKAQQNVNSDISAPGGSGRRSRRGRSSKNQQKSASENGGAEVGYRMLIPIPTLTYVERLQAVGDSQKCVS